MIKTLFKYAVYGVGLGCFLIMVCLLMMDFFWPNMFNAFTQNFAVNVLSGLAISTASSTGAIAYEFDRLNFGLQAVVHIAIVLVVALPIALWFGWFSAGSPAAVAVRVAAWVIVFIAAWFGFYLFGNREVRKINDKIKERDSQG